MNVEDLTQEQISKLTPEQMERIEEDPDTLDEILAGQDKATPKADKPEQTEQDGVTNDAGEDDEEDEKGEEESDEEEEPVVLNKSGKGVIPYEAHKGLRVENATLKEQLEQATTKLAEMDKLKALIQEKQDAQGDEKATDKVDNEISKRIKALNQDYPELGELMEAVLDDSKQASAKLQQKTDKLEKALEELQREKEEAKRVAEKSVIEQVAEARDNNPDLAHWLANDQEAFEEATRQDAVLRESPKWAKVPYAERFEEVVRRVRAVMPEASAPKSTKQKSTEQVQATAKAKLDKAPSRKLTTVSDIPSGGDPTTEKDLIENLSGHQLTSWLMKMPEHLQAAMRAGLD